MTIEPDVSPSEDVTPGSPEVLITAANRQVLDYIETTFNDILREIKTRPHGRPVIILKRIISVKPYHDEADFMQLKWHIEDRQVQYHYPGKTKDEAWRFACVGRLLSEIYSAIKEGITVTKRDIFYHDPALFRQQETVDRYVDDIAYTCQVSRSDLNVTASPKGLIAGLHRFDGADRASMIHAPCRSTAFGRLGHLKWILVIEKEATFNALLERQYHQNQTTGPGLLVTARGYPDVATRHFLRQVCNHTRTSVQVFGLFDWDPHGIQILKCFRFGSKNLAQEHHSNIPEMRWIGLKAEDVVHMGSTDEPSIRLTLRDRSTALSMLASKEWRDESGIVLPGLQEATLELQRMLMLNRKAEIQILDEREGGLEQWLTRRLGAALCKTTAL